MNFQEILQKLVRKEALEKAEMESAMEEVVAGKAQDANIEEFLVLLRQKGETADEITAAATVMRRHALGLSKRFPDLLDTCGTGADQSRTVNVSTLASFVAAAAGIRVAKHGNRAVSGVCGSADLLELLGVRIELEPDQIQACLEKTGFAFFFAPRFHPATRFAMPARKRIKDRTIFNLLGPLSNPAGARFQLVGVYDKMLTKTFAEVLRELGAERALVVHGSDGMDEITTCGETFVSELLDGRIVEHVLHPKDFGLPTAKAVDLQCDSKESAKQSALAVLSGEPGPKSDLVALNAAAAIYVAGKSKSMKGGLSLVKDILSSKKTLQKLEEIVAISNSA